MFILSQAKLFGSIFANPLKMPGMSESEEPDQSWLLNVQGEASGITSIQPLILKRCCGSDTPFCFCSINSFLLLPLLQHRSSTAHLKTCRPPLSARTLSSWPYTRWSGLRCLWSSIDRLWGAAAPLPTACPLLLVCSSLVNSWLCLENELPNHGQTNKPVLRG